MKAKKMINANKKAIIVNILFISLSSGSGLPGQ